MKRLFTSSLLSLSLALCMTSPAVFAKSKQKASPEHKAAVKKCNDDYQAALTDAKSKKGKDHKEAVATAKKNHKECLTSAPK